MLLAAVAEVRETLGFDDMTDINAAITGALDAAEHYLAGVLGTPFDRVTTSDLFWVERPGFRQQAHVQTEFRLKRGLIDINDFSTAQSPLPTMAGSIALTDIALHAPKGLVTDYRTAFDHAYVRFTYTAGFPVDADNPLSYALATVPRWLQSAAKTHALITLETHPSLVEAGVKQDTTALKMALGGMLRPYIRYTPAALLPI